MHSLQLLCIVGILVTFS